VFSYPNVDFDKTLEMYACMDLKNVKKERAEDTAKKQIKEMIEFLTETVEVHNRTENDSRILTTVKES
jgi:uncharacterized hydantoinase/oxoprolinase family protein